MSREHDNREWQRGKVLLVGKVFVCGQEGVELLLRSKHQELAVLYTSPTHLDHGLDGVARQGAPETTWQRLVKQQPHRQTALLVRLPEPLQPFLALPTESLRGTHPKRSCLLDSRRGSVQGHGYL